LLSFNTLSALIPNRNRAPKIFNSLKQFGALAECSALRKAFPRSRRFDRDLLRFGAALKHHQSAVGVNYALPSSNSVISF
jgi:hypothetical protein